MDAYQAWLAKEREDKDTALQKIRKSTSNKLADSMGKNPFANSEADNLEPLEEIDQE